jgi:leader peptidase (prepilin peptidase)/N-methyltransferase
MGIFFLSSIFIFRSWTEVLLWLILAALGLPLVVIDLQKHRLPDPLTVSLFTMSAIVILTSSIINSRFDRLLPSLIGSVSLVAFYLAVMFISKGGMGMGDVKLSASIGLISGYFGVKAVLISCFSAYALGSVLGIALIMFGKAGRKTAIPFGPFMIVGQAVSLITISHSLL